MALTGVKALTFDVFGTVVDWRSSIIREGEAFGKPRGLSVDWAAFADRWRALYQPAMEEVRSGKRGWTKLDDLHRESLGKVVTEFGIKGVMAGELSTPVGRCELACRAVQIASEIARVVEPLDFRRLPEGTEITLTISYVPPLGVVGQLVAGEVDALVRGRLERALAAMKQALESEAGG